MSLPETKNEQPKPAGHVRHDSTGRAIWEWAAESGRHAIDSTSRLLKRLEMPGLTLADDASRKKKNEEVQAAAEREAAGTSGVPTFGGSREKDPLAHSRQSFNPYDSRTPAKRGAPAPPPRPAPRPTGRPAVPTSKPGFFARLFGKK